MTAHQPQIAFQSPGWPAARFCNGIASYVANLRRGLFELGVQSRVLASLLAAETGETFPEAIDLRTIAKRATLYDRALYRLCDALPSAGTLRLRMASTIARAVDELQAQWPVDLLELEESFGLARFVAPWARIPVVVRLHGPWFLVAPALGQADDPSWPGREASEGWGLEAAAGVTSPSRHVLEAVRRHYGLALPVAKVIPNPAPVVPAAQRWRPATGGVQTLLFVGRFDRLKGADLAVRAFCRIARTRPRLELALVGPDRGLVENGQTFTLPTFLDAHVPGELRARIRVFGERTGEEVARLRQTAAVTLVPSRYETFPMTALEALASGAPLVAAAVGGVPEIVEDGVTGLLVRGDDPEALAAGLARLLDDPALASRLGARAGSEAERRFSPAVVARSTLAFYQQVLAERPLRARRGAGSSPDVSPGVGH